MTMQDDITIENYLNHHYLSDLTLFLGFEPECFGVSGLLCGATIGENLREYRYRQFTNISAFFCCQYALNLLDFGIRKYSIVNHCAWIESMPPFADSTACSMYHGGVNNHSSMLRYLRQVVVENGLDIRIDNDDLNRYLIFFLKHIDSTFPTKSSYRLYSRRLCDALNTCGDQMDFKITWPSDDAFLS